MPTNPRTETAETDAAHAGADIERTTNPGSAVDEPVHTVQTQPVSDEQKTHRDVQLTTDPDAQNTDTVIDPTNS